jgi:hypothetical protein
MTKCLDTYDIPKLNQEDINSLSRSMKRNVVEAVIVSQNRKVQDQIYLILNSYRLLKN